MKANGLNGAGGIAQLMNAMLGANAADGAKPAGPDFESLLQQAGGNQKQPEAEAAPNQQGDGQTTGQNKTEAAAKPADGQGANQDGQNVDADTEQQALAAALVTVQPQVMPNVQPVEVVVDENGANVEAVPTLETEEAPQIVQTVQAQTGNVAAQAAQPQAEVAGVQQQMQAPVQTAQNQTAEPEMVQNQDGQPQLQTVATAQPQAQQNNQSAGEQMAQPQMQQGDEMVAEEAAGQSQTVFAEVDAVPVKVREAEVPLEPQADDAADQLAAKLNQALSQGESRVTVNLNPANLGTLTVEMTRMADGTLNVVLSVVTEKAANLLQQHSNSLQNLLQAGGQGQVRVEVENRMPEDAAQQFLNPDQEQGKEQQQQEQQQHKPENDNPAAAQVDFMQQLRLGLVDLAAQER